MAFSQLPLLTRRASCIRSRSAFCLLDPLWHRKASSQALDQASIDASSSFDIPPPSTELAERYDPIAQSKLRRRGRKQLPPSRYQYRPPKHVRGLLHPHQPPPVSDPASRLFQPGPFTLPRLEQTYQSTIAADLLTLTYQHSPPGYRPPVVEQRLRKWEGDSPYFKNRPLRPPRGKGGELHMLTEPRTFRNIPKITRVTVHSMVPEAQDDSAHMHVAGMILQAITNVRCVPHKARHHVTQWSLRQGRYVSLTSDMVREDAHHFLSKLIDVVLPKIKEWKGVPASSSDGHGNISFGLTPDQLALFPEIEVNYDAYPPKMIPGCYIFIHTDATNDWDARLLFQAIGVPFHGKLRD